jgi:hypothetical protein
MRDTIDMAREVDPVTKLLLDKKLPQGMDHDVFMWFLERFAALVRADEREACAKVCERIGNPSNFDYVGVGGVACAESIRARGNT